MKWLVLSAATVVFVSVAAVTAQDGSTTVITNACEDTTLELTCPANYEIRVQYANYGRLDKVTCPREDDTLNSVTCSAISSLPVVQKLCDKENSCRVDASNALFGDACDKTTKYLTIVHQCVGQSILMQQHYGGTTFFTRTWDEFKVGFGDVTGNYWIGNERLHQLTKDGRYKLRVDLQAKYTGQWYWAEYQTFKVGDESSQYLLEIGGHVGTAGDSMAHVNGKKFSTKDRDNDSSWYNCAVDGTFGYGGGFWYNNCLDASPNSPAVAANGFLWSHLPTGTASNQDKKLVSSRFTLLLK